MAAIVYNGIRTVRGGTVMRFNPSGATSVFYHDMPRDKVKLARERAAKEKEKEDAFLKYQPFQEVTPMNEVLEVIRSQAKLDPQMAESKSQSIDGTKADLMSNSSPSCSHGIVDTDVSPYTKEQKKCIICKHKIPLDYKNVRLLSQFVSPFTGRIYGSSVTGLCMPMQSRIGHLIKRARKMGFMPVTRKDERFLKDPELFNPFAKRI